MCPALGVLFLILYTVAAITGSEGESFAVEPNAHPVARVRDYTSAVRPVDSSNIHHHLMSSGTHESRTEGGTRMRKVLSIDGRHQGHHTGHGSRRDRKAYGRADRKDV